MFFFLSKVLDVAVDPFWWSFVSMLSGVALLTRVDPAHAVRRRRALRLLAFGLACLFIFSLPAVSNRLWRSLESGVESSMRPDVTYDAVVLLGGTVSPGGSLPDEPAWNDNVERLLTVQSLLASGKAKVAIVSGGVLSQGLPTEAEFLSRELRALGIPAEAVLVEDKALNTRENATESKRLLEQLGAKNVLLVTSAFHVPRAVGCFRAVGIEADVRAVDYRLRDLSSDPHLAPRAEYLSQSARAIREWLGRAVYSVLGYTKSKSA
ncbi:MAG: YdcF family protein [Archangium sp.]|nr:YdcF family protein [Archangium sp.]